MGLEEPNRDPFDVGLLRSCGGEAAKHSSRVSEDEVRLKSPHPNWKGGGGGTEFSSDFSSSLKETELDELFLERIREGLSRADLRRLRCVSRDRAGIYGKEILTQQQTLGVEPRGLAPSTWEA